MAAPRIAPGRVEQAIYTWSKHNLSNGKGQGITEVSPGLRDEIPWLVSIDLNRLRPFDGGGVGESDGYDGWKELVTTGAFPVGELVVVYRKIASAGKDGARRNRFIAHMLIGNAGELDLASVSEDDPNWLDAGQCPLDRPPKLSTLDIAGLKPRRAAHDCASFDAGARDLLRRLISSPGELSQAGRAGLVDLTAELLAAVPTALWPGIDLTCWVGASGPVYRATTVVSGVIEGAVAAERVERVGLGDCALHAAVDEIWAGLDPSSRSWESFARAFGAGHAPSAGVTSREQSDRSPATPGHSPRRQVADAITAATGVPAWDEHQVLGERQALPVFAAIERLAPPSEGWLSALTSAELRAILGGIESSRGFSRTQRFLEQIDPDGDALLAAWQESGVAALGLALLSDEAENPRRLGDWAVPSAVDPDELAKLVGQLLRSERGLDAIALLVQRGFSSTHDRRRQIVDALVAGGASPRYIFATVLSRADLSSKAQLHFLRENTDLVSRWLAVPEPWGEAFRAGLAPRRLIPSLFVRHASRAFSR